MRFLLRGCAASLLLAVTSAASDRTLANAGTGRPIRTVDELDPVADYGKRHRIIDEYILFADTACTGPCLNGMRDKLLEAPHKCRDVLVLNEVQVVVATCPSAASSELHFRHMEVINQLSSIPNVASVEANEGQVMLHPSENPAVTQRGNGGNGGKRLRRQLQTLNAMNPYNWGVDRIDQQSPLTGSAATSYSSSFLDVTGEGVEVMIMDSGVTMGHDQFSYITNKITKVATGIREKMEDGNGHGTHVASSAMGKTLGVARLPAATLISFKALTKIGTGSGSYFLEALDYAVTRAKADPSKRLVVNMSLGWTAIQASIDAKLNQASTTVPNLLLVAAAGNENKECGLASPNSARVVNVGASDRADTRASFSNFGSKVHLYAPGVNILGALKGSTTGTIVYSGTSMASPHITGAVAQLMAKELALIRANPSAPKCSCANNLPMSECVYVKFLATTQKVNGEAASEPSLAYIGNAADFSCPVAV